MKREMQIAIGSEVMYVIKTIFDAINNKDIISIEYKNENSQNNISLIPMSVFSHNNQEYLIGEETRTNIIKTYLLAKIERVDITPLKYDKKFGPIKSYINKKYFRNQIKILKGPEDITSSNISSTSKYSNQINYLIDSIRKEEVKFLKFHNNSDEIFRIYEGSLSINSNNHKVIISLPNNFKQLYSLWTKVIQNSPDLSIYIGYPVAKDNNKIIPIFYFRCQYDVDNNSLVEIDKGYINHAFCEDEIELTEDEIRDILNKNININDVEKILQNSITDYHLTKEAYVFLQRDSDISKNLIKDIKEIDRKSFSSKVTEPLQILFESKDKYLQRTMRNSSLMLAKTNESQTSAITKAMSNCISVIQGPPGTGKTQTIINIIANNFILGEKTLVTSNNNKAVDNIYELLEELEIHRFYLRLGNRKIRDQVSIDFNNYIQELKLLLESNNKDLKTLMREIINLLASDKQLEKLYYELLAKLDQYRKIVKEIEVLEVDLLIENEKLRNREIDIPEDDYINKNKSNELLNKLETVEYVFTQSILKLEGRWTFIEKIIGIFRSNEKKYLKKTMRYLKSKNINIEVSTSLDELIKLVSHKIDFYKYCIIARNIKDLNKIISKINPGEIEKEIEEATNQRIDISKSLINKQVLINLMGKDLNAIELNYVDPAKYKALLEIFPVILCTNLSVPYCVSSDFRFDMGIIDEASQCDIPSSIPLLKRSDSLVVIGDDKQLKPITQIDERIDDYNMQKYNINPSLKYKDNSLFDSLNKITNTFTFLDKHYRSKNSIIQFSNLMFYQSKLEIMTNNDSTSSIKLINTKGLTKYSAFGSKSAFNSLEIQAIFDYLENLKDEDYKGTIGIITPFRMQKDLINQSLMKYTDSFYNNVQVGTVHTFQGREMDTIIYSTVISKNAKKGSIDWLNKNTFITNVAITRAKDAFILVCDEEELLKEEGILRELVVYTNSVGLKSKFTQRGMFDNLRVKNNNFINNIRNLLNTYENKLYDNIKKILEKKSNYEVYIKVRVADVVNIDRYKHTDNEKFSYGLMAHFDFVITRTRDGIWPICVIELDGRHHSHDKGTIYRDKIKDDICTDMGLEIIRYKSDDYRDLNKLIEYIIKDDLK